MLEKLKIAFLRNVTMDLVVSHLRRLCEEGNFEAAVHMGGYNNVLQDVMDKNNHIYRDSPDIIIVCLKLEILAEKLTSRFSSLSQSEINEESGRVISFIDKAIGEIRKNSTVPVLIHNFETPAYPSFGILDYQDHYKQVNTIRRLNKELLDIARNHQSAFIIDVDLLQSRIGYLNFIDNRFWHIGKAPYTNTAYEAIAEEYMKFVHALKGKSKKCLVLDCDNTLWGGLIGEEGINKIKLGNTYPGSAYLEFQQTILNLYHRGVVLAICSKNNEEDVLEVMRKHPDMALREGHFISMKINWKDKAANLKEISNELNIGLDSIVFIDESDFEINLVKTLLPDVRVIRLPEDPTLYKDVLRSSGIFDTLLFSEEDRKRSRMYRAEVKRKSVKAEFKGTKIEDYYRYLEMEVAVNHVDPFSIPRISQLTQRTNQFNLTNAKYPESKIKAMSDSSNRGILCLRLKDRFEESGVVGAAILKYGSKKAVIDTFLLSCRVIGRGVEDVLLSVCMTQAAERGCEKIIGLYRPTPKNVQVEGFYARHKFSLAGKNKNETMYELYLTEAEPTFPDYFRSITVNNKSVHGKKDLRI